MNKRASRRKAREAALRTLYAVEIGKMTAKEAIEEYILATDLDSDLKKFAEKLTLGVEENLSSLDEKIEPLITEYAYNRLASVDRNVIRLAAYEILFMPAIPPAVSINEAVEIARKYSMEESGKFVNGVLGALLQNSSKINWSSENAPDETEFEEEAEFGSDLSNENEEVDGEVEWIQPDSAEVKLIERHGKKVGTWIVKDEENAEKLQSPESPTSLTASKPNEETL